MNKKWYWTELIGFDRTQEDLGVGEFLSRISNDIEGVSLLIYSIDFVNYYKGLAQEENLLRSVCSYGGHPYNEDRAIQQWTNYELKKLIDIFHQKGLPVYMCVFDIYWYRDENGNLIVDDSFVAEHPELLFKCSYSGATDNVLHVMKRFSDGSYYRDFFIDKLKEVLVDYGFDGYHFADGLSSIRFSLQSGDYCDDLVSQFCEARGVKLPEKFQGKCDGDDKKLNARYKYIMENLRYEYICFVSDWFADFYTRLANTLKPLKKKIIFNNAWTRDPFEALFRYGLDYEKACRVGIDAMMTEDAGCYMPLLTQWGLGIGACGISGPRVEIEDRRHSNLSMYITQLSIACHVPEVEQYTMTTMKDTQEDYNMIINSPTDLRRMIIRRNNAWVSGKDGLRKASHGPMYCLADGHKKEHWDMISSWEAAAQIEAKGVMGFTAIWDSESLYRQVKRFIDERKPSPLHLYYSFMVEGVSIASMAKSEEIDALTGPIIVTGAELYSKDSLDRLEKYKNAPMIVTSYKNPLKRKADAVITECANGLSAYFYNCKALAGKKVLCSDKPKKAQKPVVYDDNGGAWAQPLKYERPSKKFLKELRKTVESLGLYPIIKNGVDCRIMTYYTGPNSAVLFLGNESFSSEDAQIVFPHDIKSIKSRIKPFWYNIGFEKDTFYCRVNNRDMEVLDITW